MDEAAVDAAAKAGGTEAEAAEAEAPDSGGGAAEMEQSREMWHDVLSDVLRGMSDVLLFCVHDVF